ncbi:hypothetical protein RM533_05955 [Croceicoccus sp. F390]|uniref:Uncharacterized protein n=1 Tax=Croceicoccus esteveae TaxID=3075597 RepID=A0ABU2ZGL0_9SPHN|nr:hypothetical protein [Croceicoccus sp. F390]MDT0575724.1 hypothetical protein [Croceicoccus sp. F390]
MAFDIIARAVAMAAQDKASRALLAGSPRIGLVDRITNLAAQSLDHAVELIVAGGHAGNGNATASYVSDALANAELRARFPLFCWADQKGRYFRLLPDAEGLIAVSAGGVIGTDKPDHSVNHQPGIQQALDYAAAIKANGARFDKAHYSLRTPLRTPTSDGSDINSDFTGHPIIINSRQEMRAAAGGTTLHRRCNDGSDPAILANTQKIAKNRHWRGGLIFLRGRTVRPADYDELATLILRGDWTLRGGIARSATGGLTGEEDYYKLNADGSGWDILDKGIWLENDRHVGDVVFDGMICIDGFRGELFYQGGRLHGSIYQKGRLELANTDADAFNPGPSFSRDSDRGEIIAEKIVIHDAHQALEGASGYGASRIGALTIRDCGMASGLMAGWWSDAADARDYTPSLSMGTVVVERSGEFWPLRWNQIERVILTDTFLRFGNGYFNVYGAHVGEAIVRVEGTPLAQAIAFSSNSAIAGSRGTYDCTVQRLICERTANGVKNNAQITTPVIWSQSLGDRLHVGEIMGETLKMPEAIGSPPDFGVAVGRIALKTTQFSVANIETGSSTLDLRYSYVGVHSSNPVGIWPVKLPSPQNRLPRGAQLHLFNDGTAPLAVQISATRLDRRMIMLKGGHAIFETDGYFWFPLTPHAVLSGNVTATMQKGGAAIAPGEMSDEVMLTVNGARPLMNVRVACTSVLPGSAQMLARVSADNTVAVRVRNNGSQPLTLPSAGYKVALDYLD